MQFSRSDLLLRHLRSDATDEEVALATTVLRRILSNVLEHPLEGKYRSINLHSKSWREQVAGLFCFSNEDHNEDEEGTGRRDTTDGWLVCWCRDELLATVEQRPMFAVGGTSSATFQSFLVLGGAVLHLTPPPDSVSASPSGGALLDALAHPSRQKLLAACEDALKAVEVLRSSTAAHRLVLRQKRERVGPAEVKPDDSRHVDLVALVSNGGAAATPSEMRLVRNSIEAIVKLWISAQQTTCRQASPPKPVSVFEDNDVVCMPTSFVRGDNVAQLTSPSACAEPPVQRPSHPPQLPPCVAAFWKRVLTLADAACATSIQVDMGRLQELEDDMVNSASVTHISAAARAAVKERARRDFKLSSEQMKPSVWPAELLHTATSLVLDIGSLVHQCTTLEQQHQPQHAHTTESATVESGDDDASSPMSTVPQDPRMQLTRRDRIEMRRLLDLFEENGDIEYLHAVKATWADTLVRLKRTYKTPTVYSAS